MARTSKSADNFGNAVRGPFVYPVTLGPDSQHLDYTGPEGLQFDDKGMVLPHSILGSLEDFKSYLEVRGEKELVKRIPKSQREPTSTVPGRHHSETVEKKRRIPLGHTNIQSNALQHWHTHMRQRRRQQDLLSGLLHRPVEYLLMNQASRFREIQEQREFLNQVKPLVQSGYGYHVGSEFWSLPQQYGDEISGITATLTRTEQGKREPVTHVGQPRSVHQESGITCPETLRPTSWTRSLQQQCPELGEVLRDMDIKKPDINELEVIGSGKPFNLVTVCNSPLLENEEEEEEDKEHKEMNNKNVDPLAQYEDVQSNGLLIPALRFCGQLARWTGNSPSQQGEVGINATIIFEALTGEKALSYLELHNEGRTPIFYSWKQLHLPQSFSNLRLQTKSPHFYFNSSSGVILPGDAQRMEFTFKSERPGIETEVWQLNTHPLLLQGASMQVTLRGVSLYQDRTANQRLFIETKLEKAVMVKMCRSLVNEVLQGIYTPERPSSPAELYITEEQEFLSKNPKLQYLDQPVGDLKRLWQEVNPGHTWDLSIASLRQVVLSLPEQESLQDTITREKSLAQLNCLLLKLSEPSPKPHQLTATAIGQHLWRRLLDTMADEAMCLKHLLSMPESDTWINKKKPPISDSDLTVKNIEQREKLCDAAAKEERSVGSKDDNNGESESAATEKSVEERKPHPESVNQQPPGDQTVEVEIKDIYTSLLHQKVYALMEDLVDTLCDLMDELNVGDEQDTHIDMNLFPGRGSQ